MIDSKDLFHTKETVIGHVETSAGGLLLTDGGWEEDLPITTQKSIALDLNIDPSLIPVISVIKNNKRFLILAIDDAEERPFISKEVEITDKVEIPKEDEEEEPEEDQ